MYGIFFFMIIALIFEDDIQKYIYVVQTAYIMLLFNALCTLGVKVRNMKMDFNIYGTWFRVRQ